MPLSQTQRIQGDPQQFSVNNYFEQTQNALNKYRNAAAIYKETQNKIDELAGFDQIVQKIEKIKHEHSFVAFKNNQNLQNLPKESKMNRS